MNTKCLILVLAVALLVSSSFGKEPVRDDAKTNQKATLATPDAAWDAVFTRTSGWTGGDCVGTVDLGDGRVLWLFGDTWIGDVIDGRHKPGFPMVNNSIAIQSPSGKPSEPPAASEMRFYWHADSKTPHAWIVPKRLQVAADEKQSDSGSGSNSKTSHGWYWPTGGGTVVHGPGGRPRLVVFFFHIGKQEGKGGIWAFKSLGGAMAIVDNVADPVEKWNVRQFDIPFAVGTDAVRKNAKLREISWGAAACQYRPADGKGREWLYIYGIRNESPLNRQVLLARANVDSPSRFKDWQFYAGRDNSGTGKWSAAVEDCVPIAEHVTNEISVERLPGAQQPTWIMVHSEPPLGPKIFVRTAHRPEGPWTEPVKVYSAPEVDRNKSYFAYAAKGHLQLSRPDELLISYVVNAHDFGAMVNDATIYRPRFIRVPIKAVLSERGDPR